ncbi:MAG: ATP-binding protein, partial [Candidatus Caldarchaeum sp.]
MLGGLPIDMFGLVTPLGMALIGINLVAVIAAFVLYIGRGNAPLHVPSTSYRAAWVVKVLVAFILYLIASSEGASFFSAIIGPVTGALKLLGPGYFVFMMVLDIVLALMLLSLEFYKAYLFVIFNVFYVPLVNLAALLYAYKEQRDTINRVRNDVYTGDGAEGGVAILGYAVKTVMMVEQVVRGGGSSADVRRHLVVKNIPVPVEVCYSPTVSKHVFNPHLIIAGSSGTGKTTTVYSLVTQLMEHYPIILFDVKGDFTEAIYERKLIDSGKASILVASVAGVNPFARASNETPNEMLEDLMDSISVIEEVGAKQAHFIREAAAKIKESGKPLTYEKLVVEINKLLSDVLAGKVKYGPQTKDALQGIAAKLSDLGEVFRSSGVEPAEVYASLVEGSQHMPLIVVNLAWVNEKMRAIVLELLLRKLHKVMQKRSSLAYLSSKPVVVVVDEAYLVTRPTQRWGGRDASSKSKLEEIVRTGRSYGVALILSTQRLSDFSDGIRQSCFRWVVFNTPSPEDVHVLSGVAPSSIVRLINDLDKGEAYIKMPTPDKYKQYIEKSERAIVEGYIFRMRRAFLTQEQGKGGINIPVCGCGYVKASTGKCLTHRVRTAAGTGMSMDEAAKPPLLQSINLTSGAWFANGVVESDGDESGQRAEAPSASVELENIRQA